MARISGRWLVNAIGGAAVLFGSFFVTLVLMDTSNPSLLEDARRGVPVRIKLDPKACAAGFVGGLSCDTAFQGRYAAATNSWTIVGRARGSDKDETRSDTNAPNVPGGITLWGMTATFDRYGRLTRGDTVVGLVEEEGKSWLPRLFR